MMQNWNNRIVEVIMSSTKPFKLMMGKILGIGLVGLTQFALWIILGLGVIVIMSFLFSDQLMKRKLATNYSRFFVLLFWRLLFLCSIFCSNWHRNRRRQRVITIPYINCDNPYCNCAVYCNGGDKCAQQRYGFMGICYPLLFSNCNASTLALWRSNLATYCVGHQFNCWLYICHLAGRQNLQGRDFNLW